MRAAFVLIVLLVALSGALTAPANGQEPVRVEIQGPTAVAPSSTHSYSIRVTGGPAEINGTFEISYVLQGETLQGADPQVARTLANREGVWDVNVTAPQAEGNVVLFVTAKSSGESGNETTERRLSIDVARPIEFRATIRNSGAAAALNVTALFYLDGRLIGNSSISRIEAGGQAAVNLTYIPVGLALGQHTLRVTADLDRDGVLEDGELVAQEFIYKSERSVVPTILGTITVFILVILVLVLFAIRRQRRQG